MDSHKFLVWKGMLNMLDCVTHVYYCNEENENITIQNENQQDFVYKYVILSLDCVIANIYC